MTVCTICVNIVMGLFALKVRTVKHLKSDTHWVLKRCQIRKLLDYEVTIGIFEYGACTS